MTKDSDCASHRDGDGSWRIHDGHGIYMCRVCPKCIKDKLSRYRPDIFEAYVPTEPLEEE